MRYLDKALNVVDGVAGNVVTRGEAIAGIVLSRFSRTGKPVTVTISRPRAEVEQVWRDGAKLSQILGEVADVTQPGPNRYQWTVHGPGDRDVVWESELIESNDRLRFATTGEGGSATTMPEVWVAFHDAPGDLGTELTLSLRLPAPAVVLQGATFKVAYRARALLQTGEIPTLTPTPAARPGNR
jgi:uncharacterized membrane protein